MEFRRVLFRSPPGRPDEAGPRGRGHLRVRTRPGREGPSDPRPRGRPAQSPGGESSADPGGQPPGRLFSVPAEGEAIFSWLRSRRDAWPEELRPDFVSFVSRNLNKLA